MHGNCWNQPSKSGNYLYNSFADTGAGHGTDRAIVGGLLGFEPDDHRLTNSFQYAAGQGLTYIFSKKTCADIHPNAVQIRLFGMGREKVTVLIASVGGGNIRVKKIDGIPVHFSAEFDTTVVFNRDKPGVVAELSSILAENKINIARMQLFRNQILQNAIMVIETDQAVPDTVGYRFKKAAYVTRVLQIKAMVERKSKVGESC